MSASDSTSGNHLHRVLKARHLSMIAIGGSIGTGLFVASGATISQAGPGGAVFVGVLARVVDVEGVVGVLEGRDPEAPRREQGDHPRQQRGLPGAAPPGESNDLHLGSHAGGLAFVSAT